MAAKRDYYEMLGIARGAWDDEREAGLPARSRASCTPT